MNDPQDIVNRKNIKLNTYPSIKIETINLAAIAIVIELCYMEDISAKTK